MGSESSRAEMVTPAFEIEQRLAHIRDETVATILREIAALIASDVDCTPEPVILNAEGAPVREGALNLPRRGDIETRSAIRTLVRRVESKPSEPFEPMSYVTDDGTKAAIATFAWDRLHVFGIADAGAPNWQPLRLWFLEWFQPRNTDVHPELSGVLHSLTGPKDTGQGYSITIDLGSAPIDCIPALIEAMALTGCYDLTLGPTSDD